MFFFRSTEQGLGYFGHADGLESLGLKCTVDQHKHSILYSLHLKIVFENNIYYKDKKNTNKTLAYDVAPN